MVPGQAEGQPFGRRGGTVDDDDVVAEPADTQDRHVRRVDDRREHVDTEHSERTDGERAAFQLLELQRARTRCLGQPGGLGTEGGEIEAVGVANDGNHQPVVECNGETDVDVGQDGDAIGSDLGVDVRVLAQGAGRGGHDVVGEADRHTRLLAPGPIRHHCIHVGVHRQRQLRHLTQ